MLLLLLLPLIPGLDGLAFKCLVCFAWPNDILCSRISFFFCTLGLFLPSVPQLLTLCLLQQVITPVGHVEDGKDGWEDDPGDDVNLLGAGGELVEPGLEEVSLLLRLHVDLALV